MISGSLGGGEQGSSMRVKQKHLLTQEFSGNVGFLWLIYTAGHGLGYRFGLIPLMATLYYAKHFSLQTRILTAFFCVAQESESKSVPESVCGNVNGSLVKALFIPNVWVCVCVLHQVWVLWPQEIKHQRIIQTQRLVHTAMATTTFYVFHCGCSMNTFTCCYEAHFFHCCCHHNWVQNPFHDGIKIPKIMPLSPCGWALNFTSKWNLIDIPMATL